MSDLQQTDMENFVFKINIACCIMLSAVKVLNTTSLLILKRPGRLAVRFTVAKQQRLGSDIVAQW